MRTERPWRLLPAVWLASALMIGGCTPGAPEATPTVPASTPTGSAPGTGQPPTPTASSPVTPGTTEETVKSRPRKTAKPVDLDQSQRSEGVRVSLRSIRSREIEGSGPGEVSGPALVVTVLIRNGSKTDLYVDSAIVNLTDSEGTVGIPLAGEPARPFVGTVQSGKSATGVYVFSVPKRARSPIRVTVDYSPDHAAASFEGKVR